MLNTHSCLTDRSLHPHWIKGLGTMLAHVGAALCVLAGVCISPGYTPVASADDASVQEAVLGTANPGAKSVKFEDIKDIDDISDADREQVFRDITGKWCAGRADINSDGREDFFLWSSDSQWCGTAGCSFHIMASHGKTAWKGLAYLSMQGWSEEPASDRSISILRTKYLGYNDLGVSTFCHRPCRLWYGILRFDGKDYARFLSWTSELWNEGSSVTVTRLYDPRTKLERILDIR